MRRRYHYFGLPHTILVAADGRVVQQWSGDGGPAQVAALGAVIGAELARTAAMALAHAPHGAHPHH